MRNQQNHAAKLLGCKVPLPASKKLFMNIWYADAFLERQHYVIPITKPAAADAAP